MASLLIKESKYSLDSRLGNKSDTTRTLLEKFNNGISKLSNQLNTDIFAKTHIRGLTYAIANGKAFIFLNFSNDYLSLIFYTGDENIDGLFKANWMRKGDHQGSKTFRIKDEFTLNEAFSFAKESLKITNKLYGEGASPNLESARPQLPQQDIYHIANDRRHNVNSEKTPVLSHLTRKIRTQASDPTIKNLCERIDKGRLKPQADFQRKYVWQDKIIIKSRLIESIFLDVPIPTIYTAEEEDGSEVVIDGQQRLLTFHGFLKNEFRLKGLTVCKELNHKTYKSLGDIDEGIQEKLDEYPLRIIKILRDSDSSVRFDILERLNRGSVKLNDQELRNCIYRGEFNDFLKNISKDKYFQLLLGSKEHIRMQDVEFALRFFALYELTHLKYKPPIKAFLNSFMENYRDIEDSKLEEYRRFFKKSTYLVYSVFGEEAFNLYTLQNDKTGKRDKKINQGLFDVLMYGFTRYDQNQVMPYKDALKEELYWQMVYNENFIGAISGAGTGTREKFIRKNDIWLKSVNEIIGYPKTEPRCFSWELKNKLWESSPVCSICEQQIESVDDAEVDHIEFYWKGGRTIPENARLAHRYCNRSRREQKDEENVIRIGKDYKFENPDNILTRVENEIRDRIDSVLSSQEFDYWSSYIPDQIKIKVDERINNHITKHPYEKDEFTLPEKKMGFCDILDYYKIIKSNWKVFENIFISKSEMEKYFINLNDFRNNIRHGRVMNNVARKNGEAAIEWISSVLRL